MLLSIIIPCYNEEARIAHTLDTVRAYLKSRNMKGEIIVVNDGSTDDTLKILESIEKAPPAAQARDIDIKALSWAMNRGKGAAVREGMLKSTGDAVLFMDADLSTPVEEADKLLDLLKNHDIVIGSRQAAGKQIEKYQPLDRLILGIGFSCVVRIIFRLPYLDTQCGFKIMTKKAATSLAKHMRINGYTFDVEMLALAGRLGLKVAEVGIRWKDMAGSKISPRKDLGKIIAELIEIRKNIKDL